MSIQFVEQHFAAGHTGPLYAEVGKYKPYSLATIRAAERRGFIVEPLSHRTYYIHAPGSITETEMQRRADIRRAEAADRMRDNERNKLIRECAPDLLGALTAIVEEWDAMYSVNDYRTEPTPDTVGIAWARAAIARATGAA